MRGHPQPLVQSCYLCASGTHGAPSSGEYSLFCTHRRSEPLWKPFAKMSLILACMAPQILPLCREPQISLSPFFFFFLIFLLSNRANIVLYFWYPVYSLNWVQVSENQTIQSPLFLTIFLRIKQLFDTELNSCFKRQVGGRENNLSVFHSITPLYKIMNLILI